MHATTLTLNGEKPAPTKGRPPQNSFDGRSNYGTQIPHQTPTINL